MQQINLKRLVDVVGGKMTLKELTNELFNLYLHRNPTRTIIVIERDDELKGMRSTIYISKKDFDKFAS